MSRSHPMPYEAIHSNFAPVAPIRVLEQLFERSPNIFGSYHLLLAHHTVEHPVRFAKLFQRAAAYYASYGKPMTIIMDNSLVECGGAVDHDMVMEAAEYIKKAVAQYGGIVIAVLPDAMGDGATTRKLVSAEYNRWSESAKVRGLELMAVVQGCNWDDYIFSLKLFTGLKEVRWLGIPRILHKTLGTRQKAVATVSAMVSEQDLPQRIHLLGFSDNLHDDWLSSRDPAVEGIDSAVPVRYEEVFKLSAVVGPRDPHWFERGVLSAQNYLNIQYARVTFEGPRA